MKLNMVVLALLVTASVCRADELKVVVNPDTPQLKLKRKDIRLMYLGKTRRWDDGRRVMLSYSKDRKLLNDFSRECVGKSGRQFIMYWKQMVFTGKGAMPKSFRCDADVISYVRNTAGAIGFVDASANTAGLRVITLTN